MDNNTWNHFPKVDLDKFDGFKSSGWVTQMEHYFSLRGITNDIIKIKVGVLYLDSKQWKWREWNKKLYVKLNTLSIFVKYLHAYYKRYTHYLGWLT